MNLSLYLLTVLIWGTTWIAIKLQMGEVAVAASIAYRFALASAVLFDPNDPLSPANRRIALIVLTHDAEESLKREGAAPAAKQPEAAATPEKPPEAAVAAANAGGKIAGTP